MRYSLLLLFAASCAAPLTLQQGLAVRVHKATVACTVLPTSTPMANAQKAKICTLALLCQQAAQDAAQALQSANEARASGESEVAAETRAAALAVLADAACKHGGW